MLIFDLVLNVSVDTFLFNSFCTDGRPKIRVELFQMGKDGIQMLREVEFQMSAEESFPIDRNKTIDGLG